MANVTFYSLDISQITSRLRLKRHHQNRQRAWPPGKA